MRINVGFDQGGDSEDGEKQKHLELTVGGRAAKTTWKDTGIERVVGV